MAGRIRSPLRAVRNLFLTGLDPASLAGMAAAVAVAGEYPPPGAGGGPPEFLTGPPGQGPSAPTGGSPGEFLAPSGKRGKYSRRIIPPKTEPNRERRSACARNLNLNRARGLFLRSPSRYSAGRRVRARRKFATTPRNGRFFGLLRLIACPTSRLKIEFSSVNIELRVMN